MTPIKAWLILLAVGVAMIGLVGLAMRLLPADEDLINRPDYAAGWAWVIGRQPDGPGAASPYLRTDAGTESACSIYADGFAQLDGVQDVEAFLAGCHDAVTMTDLETQEQSG